MNIIDTLSLDTIKTCLNATKGGVITRVSYMTELPLKAEFKKLGYKVIKVTDTSVRFGVDYSKIAKVIAKKTEATETRKTTNNYTWLMEDKLCVNEKTGGTYIRFATLPKGAHTKVKFIVVNGNITCANELTDEQKNFVINSYWNKAGEKPEVQNVNVENVIRIGKVGYNLFTNK